MEPKTPTHTATPWTSTGRYIIPADEGVSIAQCTQLKGKNMGEDDRNEHIATANAAFIVRAVNSHAELLDLVKRLNYAFYVDGTSKALKPIMAETKQAIARAEGGLI
jgi:protein-disulfide isomerase-like protein with CxxC motif